MTMTKTPIYIWRIQLQPSPEDVSHLLSVLDEEELARYRKLIPSAAKQQFILSHYATRIILAYHLNLSPSKVRIYRTSNGKPTLDSSYTLYFNLTHSHNLALLAVSSTHEVGIDIEYQQRAIEYTSVGKRFFSPLEYRYLQSVDPKQQRPVFFTIWTRKEAFIKALGEGLRYPLSRFSVSPERSTPINVRDLQGKPLPYTLHDIPLADDYSGALAIRAYPHTDYTPAYRIEDFPTEGFTQPIRNLLPWNSA